MSAQLHTDVRFIGSKPDHLFVFASFVGLGGPTEVNGFQNIGFALGIISKKKCWYQDQTAAAAPGSSGNFQASRIQ